MAIPRWKYTFCDLITGAQLAPNLPLSAVTLTSTLNDIGTFSATLTLGDPAVMEQDPMGATIPYRTAMFAAYGHRLMWGGIVTGRRAGKNGSASLDGKEFLHYFNRRRVRATLAPVATDQLVLGRWLLSTTMAVPSGAISVDLPPAGQTSGVVRIVGYDPWDLKNVYEELTALAVMKNGFDIGQELFWDPAGVPRARIVFYYPTRGNTAKDAAVVLTNQNAGWDWPEDGEAMSTTRYGTGSGDGAARIIVPVSSPEILRAGWPLLEDEDAYPDIGNRDLIAGWTAVQQSRHRLPVVIPAVTVRVDGSPALGSYELGDWAQLRLAGYNFTPAVPGQPGAYVAPLRITGYTITPKAGTVELTLGSS